MTEIICLVKNCIWFVIRNNLATNEKECYCGKRNIKIEKKQDHIGSERS